MGWITNSSFESGFDINHKVSLSTSPSRDTVKACREHQTFPAYHFMIH